jgi:rRNA maturation RNase YbeY
VIKVLIKKQSRYPVNTPKLKKSVREHLLKKGLVSDSDLSIALVSGDAMKDLATKYHKGKSHFPSVLSFAASETRNKFINPPDGIIHLGEVVVCYPKAVEEAKKEGILIEEKIIELVSHGVGHLLGEHI